MSTHDDRGPGALARSPATAFRSVLFEREPAGADGTPEPDFFSDLHLDQIVEALLAGREQYDLAPFFYQPLHDVEAVRYRHDVLGDLARAPVLDAVRAFAQGMRQMRERLALMDRVYYPRQKQRWLLDAVAAYCEAVATLADRLEELELRSAGLLGLRDHLARYTASPEFTALAAETAERQEELSRIRYAIHIKGARVTVSHYRDEPDMTVEVERTFEKFKRGAGEDHRLRFRDYPEMNHVEAQILDRVAKLHSDVFGRLEEFCERHSDYVEETIGRFDREVQFYLAYLEHIEPLKASRLRFSQPEVSTASKEEHARDTFDLALAAKLVGEERPVVCNDLRLTGDERILVVSGPNNGGKTTFARTFGQLHHLAGLGLPVPGSDVRLFLPDRVFTHFEREEDIDTLRGKFEDELFRIREILQGATGDSVLIMNESFGSTTLRDARVVGAEIMRQIIELDALCVFVTFVDELASMGPSTVSMMSTVIPEDPAVRTFKVVRKPADGLAYAAAIAEKYGLTYRALRERVAR